MQAIRTRYLAATSYKPARMKASCESGSVCINYDDELGMDANHMAVCQAMLHQLGWDKAKPLMISGNFKGDEYWVFLPKYVTDRIQQ